MKISNKVFAVTGAGNGIAQETVLQLLSLGAKVAAIDLDAKGLAETVRLAGEGAALSIHVVNITDRAAVAALPEAIIAEHGALDGLLNIAGIIQKFVPVNDLDYADIEKVINVNLYGVINMVKSFLPTLISRPEAYLMNVSSMGAYTPVPGQSVYGATKAAVRALTDGLHSELMKTNVAVTTVFPGAIGTKIAQNSGVMSDEQAAEQAQGAEASKFKMTSPVDAGKAIIAGIQKNKYHVFIGSDARMMDIMSRIAPKKTAALIYKKMGSLLK